MSDHIKVGMLTSHISKKSAGLWEAIYNLSSSLSDQNSISASIWGLKAQDTDTLIKSSELEDITACSVRGPQAFGYSPLLSKSLNHADLDIIHSHGIWMYPSLASYQWSLKNKRPIMISPHGMLDEWAVKNSHWKKKIVGWFYENKHLKSASCIHALCEEEAKAIRQYGLKQEICVIPNGVHLPDTTYINKPSWKDDKVEGRKVLLYLGRLHPKKGLSLLIDALGGLKKNKHPNFKNWVTVFAGFDQNNYRQKLERLVKHNSLENDVLFVGPQFNEAKAETFYASDAFILPSYSEGLPVVVLEAWSFGLPCLITPECHLPEGYKANAAIPIKAKTESVAEGLRHLFEMRDSERNAIGHNGEALVQERFTWQQVSKDMRHVYDWAVTGKTQPSSLYH